MSNPVAFLYDRRHRRLGATGIAVADDLVAFSPWPDEIGYTRPFVVRVVTPDGASDWRAPLGVELIRLTGTKESGNVALVNLVGSLSQQVELLRGVDADLLVTSLRTQSPRAAARSLAPTALGPLGGRRLPPVIRLDEPIPDVAVPQSFFIRSGPADVAQRSLCRIFRWD